MTWIWVKPSKKRNGLIAEERRLNQIEKSKISAEEHRATQLEISRMATENADRIKSRMRECYQGNASIHD